MSRTLATDYGITVSQVTVTVENGIFTYGPDVLTFDADTDVASGTIEDIVEGTYTVTLSAYMLDNDSNPVLVAEGVQTDIAIVSDEITNVNISMSIVVGLGDLVVNGSISESLTVFSEYWDDGDYTNNPVWEYTGSDAYIPSIIEYDGSQRLFIKRGNLGDTYLETTIGLNNLSNYTLTYHIIGVGESYSRSIVDIADDSGKPAYRFYPDAYGNKLSLIAFEYDVDGNSLDLTEICSIEYDVNNSGHKYTIVKNGNLFTLYEDDTEWNGNPN